MATLINISEAASLGMHTMALLATDPARRFTNQEIAQALNASGNHLAKVMQRLVKVGMANSTRGPSGGFLLDRTAQDVMLLEIYEAVDGPLGSTRCLSEMPTCRGTSCVLGAALGSIEKQLRDYLATTTLAELAQSLVAIRGQETET